MLINSDHRRWGAASAVVTAASGAWYGWYVHESPFGPSGGSVPGLTFGIAGTTFMVIAALLAGRKKIRVRRVGSARLWMLLHIWLGLLAVPMIWFHSGFAFGGPLTTALMVLFYVVIVSGLVGLALQQVLPRAMRERVPKETVLGQIEHVQGGLAADAYARVASVAGALAGTDDERTRIAFDAQHPQAWKVVERPEPAADPDPGAASLATFYLEEVRPYLHRRMRRRTAPPDFAAIRAQAGDDWADEVAALEAICEESRQLGVQIRLHALLHDWLFVHAPLSFAMLVLTVFHVVYALRY